ncbi:MAG: hypothetical protein F6K41_30175 [Symploca sp. SIO3E6]|nr:hypothetical protein [Caldora sp. SIO3E6]
MKFTWLSLGLLSCSSFLTITSGLTHSASAQCLQADAAISYNISGSRQPTERINNVLMESQGHCTGNTSITTSVMGNQGGNSSLAQQRKVIHLMRGGTGNETGINVPTVPVQAGVGIDVYNPADNFSY